MPRTVIEGGAFDPRLKKVETLKIIHLFKYDKDGYAGIVQVRLKSPNETPKMLVGVAGMTKVNVLAREKDGSFIIYGEGKARSEWLTLTSGTGGFRFPPFELTSEGWRITFMGGEGQVRRFLSALEKASLKYRIVAATDARFTAASFLSVLTEGQRRTLVRAYEMGYYDVPRHLGSDALSRSLGVSKSTAVEHLRKAEKRLLDEILRS